MRLDGDFPYRLRRASVYVLPGLFVAVGVVVPLGYLLLRATAADPARLGELILRPRTLRLVLNTVGLTAFVLAVDLLLAVPLAWLTTRTHLRGRGAILAAAVVPLAMPGYVVAYAYMGLFGAYGLFAQAAGLALPPVRGFLGAGLALSLTTYPYLLLTIRSALLSSNPHLEDQARLLGARPAEVFFRVVAPQIRPALLAGGLIVALHVLGDFGVVSLMRFETFTYAIYLQYEAAFDRTYAAWLALLLIGGTALIVMAEIAAARRTRGVSLGAGVGSRRYELGAWRWPAGLFVAVAVTLSTVLPLAAVVAWSLKAATGAWAGAFTAALRSATAAAPAAAVGTLCALAVAVLRARRPGWASGAIDRLAYFGYATPPLALALAFVFVASRAAPWAYQGFALLVFVYAVHFMAEGLAPIRAALREAPARIEEAARIMGRSAPRAFLAVTLPLIRHGATAGLLLVFLSTMKELPITLLLAPLGFETLATNVWTYASEALFTQAAPYALGIVAVSSALVWLLVRSEGRADRLAATPAGTLWNGRATGAPARREPTLS